MLPLSIKVKEVLPATDHHDDDESVDNFSDAAYSPPVYGSDVSNNEFEYGDVDEDYRKFEEGKWTRESIRWTMLVYVYLWTGSFLLRPRSPIPYFNCTSILPPHSS